MSRYVAETKNKEYSGKMYGVQFKEGRAVIDEFTIDKHLGWDVERIVKMLKTEHGCTIQRIARDIVLEDVEAVEESPAPPPKAAPRKLSRKKRAESAAAPQEA